MNDLVGKAQEDDDAFWGHETWQDDDSGNDSFRAEKLELQKSEKAAKRQRQGGSYVDNMAAAAAATRGKKQSGRRIMGEGFNAGIVLKFPPQMTDSLMMQQEQKQQQQQQQASTSSSAALSITRSASFPQSVPSTDSSILKPPSTTSAASAIPYKKPMRNDPVLAKSTLVSARERRSTHGSRKLRETRSTPGNKYTSSSSTTANKKATNQQSTKSAKRKRYRQEELLMEAIHETEPENKRWLYARKRVQDQSEKDANANALRDRQRGKVIQKFHSRRGCLTTLTFPEMDYVPEILTRRPQQHPPHQQHQQQQQQQLPQQEVDPQSQGQSDNTQQDAQQSYDQSAQPQSRAVRCVITGKPAKYRDPLTKQPYFDSAAFKELRRRHSAGLPIKTASNKPKASATKSTSSGLTANDRSKDRQSSVDNNANNGKMHPNPPKKLATSKKPATSNSKLPFQSPKPPKSSKVEQLTASSSNGSNTPKPDPSLAHLAFSWGGKGGKDGNSDAAASPVSPSGRRLSRRKWKPSEKVLETIAMSPKKDGVVCTPPGLQIKPQQELSEYLPPIPPPPLPSITPSAPPTDEKTQQPPTESQTLPDPPS
jgi:YL1 nuclear protein C-terminal domain